MRLMWRIICVLFLMSAVLVPHFPVGDNTSGLANGSPDFTPNQVAPEHPAHEALIRTKRNNLFAFLLMGVTFAVLFFLVPARKKTPQRFPSKSKDPKSEVRPWFTSPPGWTLEAVSDASAFHFWVPFLDDHLLFVIPGNLQSYAYEKIFERCFGGVGVFQGVLQAAERKSIKLSLLHQLLEPLVAEWGVRKLVMVRLQSDERVIEFYGPIKYVPHLKSKGPVQLVKPEGGNQKSFIEWKSQVSESDEVILNEGALRFRLSS